MHVAFLRRASDYRWNAPPGALGVSPLGRQMETNGNKKIIFATTRYPTLETRGWEYQALCMSRRIESNVELWRMSSRGDSFHLRPTQTEARTPRARHRAPRPLRRAR